MTQTTIESVVRHTLPNGLTVLVKRDTSAPVVAIVTYVKAGYFDETDDVSGIAHVLEHMFFKGTDRRGVGDIAKETKASGGYLNAHTIYDHTSYYTVLPSASFESGLDIQADAYLSSVIDADELARELEVIIQEAKRKADNPGSVAIEKLYELLHDTHRIRRWRIGTEEGLRKLRREDMMRFYRNFYRPGNTILSIAGDIDPDTVIKHVEKLYGSQQAAVPERSPGPKETAHEGFRYKELSGDIGQTQLVMGWQTPGTLHEDTPVLDLASSILGAGRASRLYRFVREKQLAASVSAFNYTPTDLGVFSIHAETKPENTKAAAQEIWSQIRILRETLPSNDEVTRAKRIFESRWLRRFESMELQANYLAEWEALGDWKLGDQYFERFMNASAEDVRRVMQTYLQPPKTGVLVYRPAESPEVNLSESALSQPTANHDVSAVGEGFTPPAAPATSVGDGFTPTVALIETAGPIHVYETEHGIPILARRKPGAVITYVGVFGYGGALWEDARFAGVTSIAMRCSIKGTTTRNARQIAEESEMLGGVISPAAAAESFGWTISVPNAQAAEATALLADVVQNATIPEDVFETERSIALSDLALLRDDMYRYPMRLAVCAAFPNHPYGIPVSGSEGSLPVLTAEQVRDWYRSRMLNSYFTLAVVGDAEPEQLAAMLADKFQSLQPGEKIEATPPGWPSDVRVDAESREKEQTALALLFPAPGRSDKDRFAAQMIGTIASGLGGRFFDELRDKQSLAYTVHSFVTERQKSGTFVSYIATSPEKEDVARDGLLREIAKLRDEPVLDDELDRAKKYTLGTHAISQESGGALMADMVDAWMFGAGLRELDEYEANVQSITQAQIQEVARQYFDEERRVEGIVRGTGVAALANSGR